MKRFALTLGIMIAAFAHVQAQFCCDDELTTKLCRLQSELASCCEDLQGSVTEIVSKVPCTPFKEINTVPYPILESGKYCVTADLTTTDENPGITIAPGVNNVLIDFNNHSLTLNSPSSVGIAGDSNSNVVLLTPIINGGSLGAIIFNNVQNLIIDRPLINTGGSNAISLTTASNVAINQPSISGNPNFSLAMFFEASNNVTIAGGSLRNIFQGIYYNTTVDSRIIRLNSTATERCVRYTNTQRCIMQESNLVGAPAVFFGGANNCLLKDCFLSGNGLNDAVLIQESSFNSIEDCLIQNANNGVNLPAAGLSNANAIVDCTIRNTPTASVNISANASNTLVRNTNYNQLVVDNGTGTVQFNNEQF